MRDRTRADMPIEMYGERESASPQPSKTPSQAVPMQLRSTYTVATLGVPKELFQLIADRLSAAGYGHAFGADGSMIDMSGIALEIDPEATMDDWHLNSKHKVAVSDIEYWRPMITCPKGAGVQLLGPGRVATYGSWDGKDMQWLGWAPRPKVPEGLIPEPDWYVRARERAQVAQATEAAEKAPIDDAREAVKPTGGACASFDECVQCNPLVCMRTGCQNKAKESAKESAYDPNQPLQVDEAAFLKA